MGLDCAVEVDKKTILRKRIQFRTYLYKLTKHVNGQLIESSRIGYSLKITTEKVELCHNE